MIIPLLVSHCNIKLCSSHDCHNQLLHAHIIKALLIAGQRVIPFIKPSKGNHKKGRPGWNEYVALEFDLALHWHRIYLDHGCLSFGFIFEMRKLTRSIYHKKVKFINKRKQKLKKQAIATSFINKNSRDFWSEMSKIRKKTPNNKCFVEGNTDDKAISLCFSDHNKQLYNSADFPSFEWKELYSYVCNDIVYDCNDRDSFTVTMDVIINAIKHLKPERVMVSTVYLLIILSTVLHYNLNIYLDYLHVCYLIVLYPLHFQSLLWSLFQKDPTKN